METMREKLQTLVERNLDAWDARFMSSAVLADHIVSEGLAIMREPTEPMLWAGRALNTSAGVTWPAMIDAANA